MTCPVQPAPSSKPHPREPSRIDLLAIQLIGEKSGLSLTDPLGLCSNNRGDDYPGPCEPGNGSPVVDATDAWQACLEEGECGPAGLGLFGVDEFDLDRGLLVLGPPSAALPGCGAQFVTCVPTNGGPLGFGSLGIHDFAGSYINCVTGESCDDLGIAFVTEADLVGGSRVGSQRWAINAAVHAFIGNLLNDSECLAFLNSGGKDAIVEATLAEFTPVQLPAGIGAEITPDGLNVEINSGGSFFSPNFYTGGIFRGGTSQARQLIVLHEVAHLTRVIVPEGGSSVLEDKNNLAILTHCQAALGIR